MRFVKKFAMVFLIAAATATFQLILQAPSNSIDEQPTDNRAAKTATASQTSGKQTIVLKLGKQGDRLVLTFKDGNLIDADGIRRKPLKLIRAGPSGVSQNAPDPNLSF